VRHCPGTRLLIGIRKAGTDSCEQVGCNCGQRELRGEKLDRAAPPGWTDAGDAGPRASRKSPVPFTGGAGEWSEATTSTTPAEQLWTKARLCSGSRAGGTLGDRAQALDVTPLCKKKQISERRFRLEGHPLRAARIRRPAATQRPKLICRCAISRPALPRSNVAALENRFLFGTKWARSRKSRNRRTTQLSHSDRVGQRFQIMVSAMNRDRQSNCAPLQTFETRIISARGNSGVPRHKKALKPTTPRSRVPPVAQMDSGHKTATGQKSAMDAASSARFIGDRIL